MMKSVVLAIFLVVLLCGCSSYRAVYEGVQAHNQLNSTPAERINKPEMNYDQYETERKR